MSDNSLIILLKLMSSHLMNIQYNISSFLFKALQKILGQMKNNVEE